MVYICPLCNGKGKITKEVDNTSSDGSTKTKTCHACFGRGIVFDNCDPNYVTTVPKPYIIKDEGWVIADPDDWTITS